MSIITHRSSQNHTVPLIYRFQRLFFAACIVLGIVATLVLVATAPQYYSLQNGIPVMVATFATASPVLLQAHLLSGVFTVYLLPVSLLAMAWLAMRRAPWLASIVTLIVFISIFPVAAFSAQDALTADLVHMGSNPLFVTIAQRFNDDGVMSYYNAMFIVGTVFAPMLIGIALWRARAVPTWAAVLILISRPLVFLYPSVQSFIPAVYVQLLSWLLLFIGSIPAALAMLKRPSNESQKVVDQEA
jgi:hypothetical protein